MNGDKETNIEKIKIGRIIKEFEITFKDVNSGGLFSQDNLLQATINTKNN
jgi:hypothetical protein